MDSITATNQVLNAPTVNLTVQYKGQWGSADIVGDMAGGLALRWSATDATSCSGSGPGFGTGGLTTGTDWQIDEPTLNNTSTYTITCIGPGGMAMDSITATNQLINAPTVNLTVKYKDQWGSADIVGAMSGGLALRWSAADATSCSGSGGGFSTGNHTSGTDWFIDEPALNNTITYTITCIGPGGMAMDSISVTNRPNAPATAPAVTLEVNHYKIAGGGWGTWGSDDVILNTGDHVGFRWQGTNVTRCSGSGTGSGNDFNVSGVSGNDYDVIEPTKGNSVTYTVTCIGSGGIAVASIVVNNPISAPTIVLKGTVYKGGQYIQNWDTYDVINIESGQEVAFNWATTDATSCLGAGSNDFDVYTVAGTDWYVTEPTAGNSTTYTVTCRGAGGLTKSSITVNGR